MSMDQRDELAKLRDFLKRLSEDSYVRMAALAKVPDCLGWEAKVARGDFGADNMAAHRRVHEMYGISVGYQRASELVDQAMNNLAAVQASTSGGEGR